MRTRDCFGFLILFTSILLGMGCSSAGKDDTGLKEYDLSSPERFNMPESLKEISGIAFNKGKNDVFYAVQDEEGKLFSLNWKNQQEKYTRFAEKGDYEDVTILKDQVFVLKSNGSLISFPLTALHGEAAAGIKPWNNLLPKGEYEGMFGDEASGKIYILCKNCIADHQDKKVSGYILNAENPAAQAESFSLNVDEIKALTGKVKKGFQPSALAKNPVTGDWFILSSVNKVLVVMDRHWKPRYFYPLSSNNFNQPEGIAFDQSGNLYISNEGDETMDGNILKFKRLMK